MALSGDSHFIELTHVLSEDIIFNYRAHENFITESGYVTGVDQLANSDVRIFRFEGVSTVEDLYPTSSLKDVLDLFYNGAEMRVYRSFPSVLTEYDDTNSSGLTGYTDMVITDEVQPYSWNDVVLGRFAFTIEGYEV